ncbi:hypothetical protein [Kribbella sp. VKM Ac-2568]|uniref:hypothetical protein n=1 Tax=Kribbella sp. VKM Ac-2568 TaxID=2512219 RepID=UPI00104D11F1|nr:hypothetical protein [Kribbella sp. VKM Ac-2568]TCM51309.1 hypothetical protein EV648_101136 [Kribbella sp. VKM Ac-2568]
MADLAQDLRTLADHHAEQATGDFPAVLAGAGARRRQRFRWSAAVSVALAVAAVAALSPWSATDGTQDPVINTPTLDPRWAGTMTITPATAHPGQEISLTFPPKSFRGLAFTISDATDRSKVLYYLSSDRYAGPTNNGVPVPPRPGWWKAGDPGGGWRAIGVNGPGPDHLIVPTTITDGTYLLCIMEDRAVADACALLTVKR